MYKRQVISLLAVGEVLHVIDSGSRTLTGIGLIFSVLIPFSRIAAIRAVLPIIIYAFIVALFCLLLARHEKMHVEEVAMTVFICILIPLSLSTIIGIRDHRGIVQLSLIHILRNSPSVRCWQRIWQ